MLNDFFKILPEKPNFASHIRRAPRRENHLSENEKHLAVQNALRYVPSQWHATLATEFRNELEEFGRIYAYRFRPDGNIKPRPVHEYVGNTLEGKAFQLMMDNNLSFEIALYPYELVTYGETGQVCQNWLQYRWIQYYLQKVRSDETLVLLSGHPLGIFPSSTTAPRVMISNAMMIGQYDNLPDWQRAQALGVANYGQMTAGGWMYIGPQGIVHGTYNTLLIAGRLKLNLRHDETLAGKLFVSSGLGGMSGAQGKAMVIAGGVALIAEVDESRIQTRWEQGWVQHRTQTPKEAFALAESLLSKKEAAAISYRGNIVDLLEYAVSNSVVIDLLSDQTSCHAVYEGGYCPAGVSFQESRDLLKSDKNTFRSKVDESLRKHFSLIQTLAGRGTYFFDYGNSFLKSVFDAGVKEVSRNKVNDKEGFIFPSYVEDILGPELFDYGYGPFRWVCLSMNAEDLQKTDAAAANCIQSLRNPLRYQDQDNLRWVIEAEKNQLVVNTQSRILYQDALGRVTIALKFNQMVRDGEISPVLLGRDHHDTGGTDSPFRETSNIKDGSNIMADMAVQSFAGNAARGMSLVALHNGGGVGIGRSVNGGFGLVLDGSPRVDEIIKKALFWDVAVGVSRRAWARNSHAIEVIKEFNQKGLADIMLPFLTEI